MNIKQLSFSLNYQNNPKYQHVSNLNSKSLQSRINKKDKQANDKDKNLLFKNKQIKIKINNSNKRLLYYSQRKQKQIFLDEENIELLEEQFKKFQDNNIKNPYRLNNSYCQKKDIFNIIVKKFHNMVNRNVKNNQKSNNIIEEVKNQRYSHDTFFYSKDQIDRQKMIGKRNKSIKKDQQFEVNQINEQKQQELIKQQVYENIITDFTVQEDKKQIKILINTNINDNKQMHNQVNQINQIDASNKQTNNQNETIFDQFNLRSFQDKQIHQEVRNINPIYSIKHTNKSSLDKNKKLNQHHKNYSINKDIINSIYQKNTPDSVRTLDFEAFDLTKKKTFENNTKRVLSIRNSSKVVSQSKQINPYTNRQYIHIKNQLTKDELKKSIQKMIKTSYSTNMMKCFYVSTINEKNHQTVHVNSDDKLQNQLNSNAQNSNSKKFTNNVHLKSKSKRKTNNKKDQCLKGWQDIHELTQNQLNF